MRRRDIAEALAGMGFLSRIFGRTEGPIHSKHGGHDTVSLVVLAPSWQPWSIESVRADLDALFPGEFLPPREVGNFVVEGPVADASYLVQCTVSGYAGMFLIHNVPGPYSAFSDFLAHIEDPDLRRIAADQPCWLSVDLMNRHTSDEPFGSSLRSLRSWHRLIRCFLFTRAGI